MILYFGDTHLKPALSAKKQVLVGDSFYALYQIAEIALKFNVNAVIIGGDVYDNNTPGGISSNMFNAFCRKLHNKGIALYSLQGNHDKTLPNTCLPELIRPPHQLFAASGLVKPLHSVMAEIDGLTVYGLDYCSVARAQEALASIPECDVLVLHHAFQHLLGFEGSYHFTLDDVPDYVKYAVMVGHVHTVDQRQLPNGAWFCSSGSTYATKSDEIAKQHGVYLMEKGKKPDYLELKCRDYLFLTDDKYAEDVQLLFNELRRLNIEAAETKPVLPPGVFVRGADRADPQEYPHIVLLEAGALDVVEDVQAVEVRDMVLSLVEALPQMVDREEQPEYYSFLHGLLETGDPKKYIDDYIRESGVDRKI